MSRLSDMYALPCRAVLLAHTLVKATGWIDETHTTKNWLLNCRRVISCSQLHNSQVKQLGAFARHLGDHFALHQQSTAPPE